LGDATGWHNFLPYVNKILFMVNNMVELIQQNLDYPPLVKVDPNTQEAEHISKLTPDQKLSQAAIPAVLAAMIKFSDGKDGVNLFSENKNWLEIVYCGKEKDAIKKVADYAGVSTNEAECRMERVAVEATRIVRDNVKPGDAEKLRSFMNLQRHNVLAHLPAALKIGDVINEDTFDDRTNKMEGPVSGFLHRIENII
jgi:hypothetical protein